MLNTAIIKEANSGYYYHTYNRGINKDRIFYSEANYYFCLKKIKKFSKKYEITVIAYCLMPNHYHLLLREDGVIPVCKFIQSVFNGYVQAINKQLKRSGTLFEGRFKKKLIEKHEYLIHLCRYINLNPVEAGIVSHPEQWAFSNYREWIKIRKGTLFDRRFVDCYFNTRKEYKSFVEDFQIDRKKQNEIKKYLFDY